MKKSFFSVAALAAGIGTMAAVAPAHADGSSSRQYGCAAHWRVTAAWNECQNSPAIAVRLRADCDWWADHNGEWKNVKGTVNPVDQHQCRVKVLSASNGFK